VALESQGTLGALLMVYTWATMAIGWLAGTAIVAGLSRFFRAI
jgi:hypothetical protein